MGIPHIQSFAIPKLDVSTTSTTSVDLMGDRVTTSDVLNLMPWAGTVQRVLVGYSQDVGNGSAHVTRWPDGTIAGEIVGTPIPFNAGPAPDILEFNFNLPFDKDDGLFLAFIGDGVIDTALRITFQVEFDFV